jgi:hypothetical protein
MTSQYAAELCELLVEENFGELFGVRLRPLTCWLEVMTEVLGRGLVGYTIK